MLDKDMLNHSTSHVMAEAIMNLYPDAKLGLGPSIENGFYYDVDFPEPITEADLLKIENEMRRIIKRNEKFERVEVSKAEALELFKDNPYKVELISGLEDGTITIYKQGKWFDLCRGPHIERTGLIKNFKLLSIAGAYWRGNSNNKMLQRIYGTSFESKEELDQYLKFLEERKARDHRKIGKDLGLFLMSEYGPGLPFWLNNGYIIRRELEDWWLGLHRRAGYMVVDTPIMLNRTLWETSGHWDHYQEDMFTLKVDDEDYAIKPMNCPGAIICYNNDIHSYRELPLRFAELGHVHRNEASGALNGLFRVRTFTQDDAHILLSEKNVPEEIARILALYDHIYSTFKLDYSIELSTRPEENYIGDIKTWDAAEAALEKACKASGHSFKINPGDGAFYGPKLDFKLKDCMGRIWQCGTVQLDMQLPGRFNCYYIDSNGEKKTPVMIHRACFGSLERFIAIITEHFAGAYPLWLAPEQIRVLPVNENFHSDKAKEINEALLDAGFRSKVIEDEKLGYRMRQAQVHKVPYTLVIGDNEVANGTVTYRHFGSKDQITVPLQEFIDMIKKERDSKALPEKHE